jgi:membrane dipeptidase
VRIIGPAWAGTRFCGGTGEPGPITNEGYHLLDGMAGFGFILDISHMDEKAALQAIDFYPGTMIASHANASALLDDPDSNRFLSDRLIEGLLERDAVIGVVPYNRFLVSRWKKSDGRQAVTLDHLVAQIDHVCQMAGDAQHVGIGSDFDGGFGVQSVPAEIDTIADLQKIVPLLAQKGYTEGHIAAIMGQNWLSILNENLPESI